MREFRVSSMIKPAQDYLGGLYRAAGSLLDDFAAGLVADGVGHAGLLAHRPGCGRLDHDHAGRRGLGVLLGDAAGDAADARANGCTDRTAEVARSFGGVRVVEIDTPSKTAALNAADEIATGDVRVYMDADVPADAGLIRRLAAAVTVSLL